MEKFIFRIIVLCFIVGICFVGIEFYKNLTKPNETVSIAEDSEENDDLSFLNATWVKPVELSHQENLKKLKEEERLKELRTEYFEKNKSNNTNTAKTTTSTVKYDPIISMTDYEVIEDSTWGKPKSINRTETAYGVREQWVYDRGYLYFEDGYLTSIQSSR